MPFITKERRHAIEEVGLQEPEPGDICYTFYEEMVREWKANPRWKTAHEIYKKVRTTIYGLQMTNLDDVVAQDLAWQVFFQLYVMPYEEKKRLENGDI